MLPLPILGWSSNCPKSIYACNKKFQDKMKRAKILSVMKFGKHKNANHCFRNRSAIKIWNHRISIRSEFRHFKFLSTGIQKHYFCFPNMACNHMLSYLHECFIIVADFLHMNIKFGINEWLQCTIALYVC